tara:strand:- start:3 stop:578 length:576 start_codon:yes stop_codon:yes gene_type:complete
MSILSKFFNKSDKNDNFIDCKKKCKMTKIMRDSKYCNGRARVEFGSIIYGCKENIENESKDLIQLHECNLIDMGIKDCCKTCKLSCVNNENEEFKNRIKDKEKLDELLEKLGPNISMFGLKADQAFEISDIYNSTSKDGQVGREAIKIASDVQNLLENISRGGIVDISFINIYSKHASKRINKLAKKKNND